MKNKIHTIWKFGICFFESEYQLENFNTYNISSGSELYCGEIEKIPAEISQLVCELHPDFGKYYEAAMMPLYKTYDNKRGTESSKWAIESLKSPAERQCDMPYIAIWIIEEGLLDNISVTFKKHLK